MVKKETVIETIKKVFFNYIESEPESLPDIASVNKLLCKAINELPDSDGDGWIPVEERLPEINGNNASKIVQVTVQDVYGRYSTAFSRLVRTQESGTFWLIEQLDKKVIAWQSLAETYHPPKRGIIPQSWIERTMSQFERVE